MGWYHKWKALVEAHWKRRGGDPAQILSRETKTPVLEFHFDYPGFEDRQSTKNPPHQGGKSAI